MGDGLWEVVIQDHDTGRQFSCDATTLEGLWEQIETVLACGGARWRPYKSYKGPAADIPEAEEPPPAVKRKRRKK